MTDSFLLGFAQRPFDFKLLQECFDHLVTWFSGRPDIRDVRYPLRITPDGRVCYFKLSVTRPEGHLDMALAVILVQHLFSTEHGIKRSESLLAVHNQPRRHRVLFAVNAYLLRDVARTVLPEQQ